MRLAINDKFERRFRTHTNSRFSDAEQTNQPSKSGDELRNFSLILGVRLPEPLPKLTLLEGCYKIKPEYGGGTHRVGSQEVTNEAPPDDTDDHQGIPWVTHDRIRTFRDKTLRIIFYLWNPRKSTEAQVRSNRF